MSEAPGIDNLRLLAKRLVGMLEQPEPGLVTWKMALSDLTWEIGDYAGKPNYYHGPENPRFKPEEMAALALLVCGSELWLPWLKGDERKAATAAVSDVRAMLEGEKEVT